MPTPPLPDHQLQIAVDMLAKYGSKRMAAKMLGMDRKTFQHRLKVAEGRGIQSSPEAVLHGISPGHDLTHPVPAPLVLKGTSTYYDEEGKVRGQWVKTTIDQQAVQAAMIAAVEAMAEDLKPVKPVPGPGLTHKHLCNLYTLTDVHVGMKAWAPETGADWDLEITEETLIRAFEYLVGNTPKASVAFVNNLGDFLHFDSLTPVTPTNQHPLDADSRYSKVVKVAVRILRRVIDRALETHDKVVVLLADGNHDQASSVWLRHLFSLLYESEQRVQVIDTEHPYYAWTHGSTMLCFHHGHLTKNERLPLLFAALYPKAWGATTKRYCHVGHWHHEKLDEHPGMKVMQHPTIAARDAYAARHGYLSERQITAITYHHDYGQVGTVTVTPEMLR